MKHDRVLMAFKLTSEVDDEVKRPEEFDLVKIIKNAEQQTIYDNCILCEISVVSQSDSKLEQHHIAGKINFNDTITVCLECHDFLSKHQKYWLPKKKSSLNRLSSYFYGWADVFDLLHNKTGSSYFENLANKFCSQAYHLRINSTKRRAIG
ncbi:hypothetical protein ACFLQ6_04940 [Thermoproteota archaeon]